jgi:hypothetical protein
LTRPTRRADQISRFSHSSTHVVSCHMSSFDFAGAPQTDFGSCTRPERKCTLAIFSVDAGAREDRVRKISRHFQQHSIASDYVPEKKLERNSA